MPTEDASLRRSGTRLDVDMLMMLVMMVTHRKHLVTWWALIGHSPAALLLLNILRGKDLNAFLQSELSQSFLWS